MEIPYGQIEIEDQVDPRVIVEGSQTPWHGRVISIQQDQLFLPGTEQTIERQFVKHPGAVAVAAVRESPDKDGHFKTEILLELQYRHPVGRRLWELPAGLLDIEGEDYLAAAKRELAEETDLEAKKWDVLVDLFTSPGGANESVRVFLARDITPLSEKFERFDEEADMPLCWVPLDDAVRYVMLGKIHNSLAIAGILATSVAKETQWQDLRPTSALWER